ncbi:Vacuolar-sorting protein SNF7 [Tulasnella sp. 417]|nr:Vacuolar-sorting protein SNF7 [Tulasnella sp. 417]
MDKFESQFADLDVQAASMEEAIGSIDAVSTPQDQIDLLLQQTAEENNIELAQELKESALPELGTRQKEKPVEEDDKLAERLRALRPAV